MSSRCWPIAIFAAAFILLLWIYGSRLILTTNDEGIILDGAQRLLEGQKLYTDFFGYMSPGAFWVQEISFRLFGITMLAARIPVLLYFSIECAVLFWLTSRLSSRAIAAVTVIFFAVFETADSAILTAQHRWDSGAIVLLAIAAAVHAQASKSRFWIAISGFAFVLAAIFTPSIALAGIVTFIWLILWRPGRSLALPFVASCCATAFIFVVYMWRQQILFGFVDQMRWLSRNYSGVNVMPYGAIIGGYGSMLTVPAGIEFALRLGILICLALPAILPVFSVIGWSIAFLSYRKQAAPPLNAPLIFYLSLCMLALIASSFPRLDVMHLAFCAAIPYALSAALVYHRLPRFASTGFLVCFTFMAALFCLYTLTALLPERRVATPVGSLRVSPPTIPEVESLLSLVRPRQTLYVHPYKPLLYFLTQAKNPTRYSYLNPGMMKQPDEQIVLQGLMESPPQWVLSLNVTKDEFLRVFPSGDPSTIEYKSIERWIHERYTPVDPPVFVSGYQLYRANSGDRP